MKVTKYFVKCNKESVDNMLKEYGSFEDGFDSPEEAWEDFKEHSDDYDKFEIVKVIVESLNIDETLRVNSIGGISKK